MVRVLDPAMVGLTVAGDRGAALAQPPVLPARAAVVSQREQLGVVIGDEASHTYP